MQIPVLNLWFSPYVPSLSVCMCCFGATDQQPASQINVLEVIELHPETMVEGILIMSSSAMTRLVGGSLFDPLVRST